MEFMYLPAIAILAYSVLEFLKNKKYHTSKMMKWLALYDVIYINVVIIYGILFDGFSDLLSRGWAFPVLIGLIILTGIPVQVYGYLLFKKEENKPEKWIKLIIYYILVAIVLVKMF